MKKDKTTKTSQKKQKTIVVTESQLERLIAKLSK
jgi:hypothetical protein